MLQWIGLKLFKASIIDWIIEKINDPMFENVFVEKANRLIDIPKMSEAEEADYFKKLYNTVRNAVVEYLEKLKSEK